MKYILAFLSLFPFIVTIISFFILKKTKMNPKKILGYSADITTPFLMVAVPTIVYAIWEVTIVVWFIAFLLLIAIVLTYKEWRTTKEIKVPILMKKIWRFYFLLLMFVYILLMVVGLIYWIVRYMNK